MSASSSSPSVYPDPVAVIPDDRRTYLLNRAAWGAIFAGAAVCAFLAAVLGLFLLGRSGTAHT